MKKLTETLGNFRDVYPKTLAINRSIRSKRFGIYTLCIAATSSGKCKGYIRFLSQPLLEKNRDGGRQSGPTRNSRTKTAKQTHGLASFISWNKQLWYCPERRHFARLDVLSSAVALDNGRSENRRKKLDRSNKNETVICIRLLSASDARSRLEWRFHYR